MSLGAGDPAVNWRRTDGGVELYDESDSDAWIRMAVEPGAPADERPFSVCPECGVVSAQRTTPGRYMVCGGCGTEFDVDENRRSRTADECRQSRTADGNGDDAWTDDSRNADDT